MIITTTPSIEGKKIVRYIGIVGIVTGETIMGANFLKDLTASFADFFGGRASSYENELIKAKEIALK